VRRGCLYVSCLIRATVYITSYEMWEFSREGTGIRFGRSTLMKMNMSCDGNGMGIDSWYTGLEGNGSESPIPTVLDH